MKISVCIATYNGEKYLKNQIDSIINELSLNDEIIVCDDQSVDETISFLENYNDSRIKIFINATRLGHVRNFEKAISMATGEYVFLSDQDDVWIPGRVKKMMNCLVSNPSALMVASNFDLINEFEEKTGEFRLLGAVRGSKLMQVIDIFLGRMPYYGCTFLFKKQFRGYFLPIPAGVESHDIWMALVASSLGRVVNIPDATLMHRIHGGNLTVKKRRSILLVLRSRVVFFYQLVRRFFELNFERKGIS